MKIGKDLPSEINLAILILKKIKTITRSKKIQNLIFYFIDFIDRYLFCLA